MSVRQPCGGGRFGLLTLHQTRTGTGRVLSINDRNRNSSQKSDLFNYIYSCSLQNRCI
jgi:hypothetical protein